MPSGHCATAVSIEGGAANSTTSADSFHKNCPGVFTSPIGQVLCDCPCHQGQEVKLQAAPVMKALAAGKPGRKGRGGLVEQIGKELKAKGSITVDAPDDPKALASLRTRLYNAANKQALKVKVTVADGKITATVK